MMSSIEMLFNHNLACREPLLQALEKLKPEELGKDLGVSNGSIWNSLIHIMNSERYWISVLSGHNFESLQSRNLDTIESLEEAWSKVHEETMEFMNQLTEDQLYHVKSINSGEQMVSFTVAKALIHIANHETHHRGLLSGLIRQQGVEPPNFDML